MQRWGTVTMSFLQIAHFLHNDEAFKMLTPSRSSLGELLLPGGRNAASVREVENLRVRVITEDSVMIASQLLLDSGFMPAMTLLFVVFRY